jgi:diguanylate cyclase (GGDEF)-like protein/PAS domain S-box-containing protein
MLALVIAISCMTALSAMRAFVGGESLWSKGQKDAAVYLRQYARSGDLSDFNEFRIQIAILMGDRAARLELQKAHPDLGAAYAGFRAGGNDADDIPAMVWMIRVGGGIPIIQRSLGIWERGDSLIDQLIATADQLHEPAAAGPDGTASRLALLAQINRIDRALRPLENEFGRTLNSAARTTSLILVWSAVLSCGLFMAVGLILSYSIMHRSDRVENALYTSEKQVLSEQRRAQMALESLYDGVLTTDAEGRIDFLNAVAENMVGWSLEEARGRALSDVFHLAEDSGGAEWISTALNGLRAGGNIAERLVGATLLDRRGRPMPIDCSLAPIRDADNSESGIVVVARDVTEHERLGKELERKNIILATEQETSLDAILLVDERGRVLSYNRNFVELWDIPQELIQANLDEPLLQHAVTQMEDPKGFLARVKDLYDHPQEKSKDILRTRNGRTIDRFTAPLIAPNGESFGRVWYFRDVTERERVETSLRSANRALRVLSTVNQALIQGKSEPSLLNLVCQALVNQGGYHLAWVGFVEHDEMKSVRPVAHHGFVDGYLNGAAITWADTDHGRGPTGTAARTGTVQVCRDIASDPRMPVWRAEALKRGYASSIALPLVANDEAFGVLTVYSKETDVFDDNEVALLRELAGDLSFGIVTHRSDRQRREAEARVEHLANFDPLTELPNRFQLLSRLQEAIERERSGAGSVALMMLSVDRFSEIQEGVGITGADDLLKKVASRLEKSAEPGIFVARAADDSFAIIIPGTDPERAHQLATSLHRAMADPFDLAGVPLDVRITSGIALFPVHGAGADALMRRADIAVRRARAAGIEYALYSGKGETETPRRLVLLAELRMAIGDDGLLLHYQPKIDVRARAVAGVEALVRWPHPKRGMVPPADFVPLAEQTGLIRTLTRWVLDTGWAQIDHWQSRGIRMPVAVNISADNLHDEDFLKQLAALHARVREGLGLLQVEVTESAVMKDPEQSHNILSRIRDLGIQIFLDDFGTGYSSLSHIAALPIHALKIDRSFVVRMMRKERHRAVVAAAISLARSLDMSVVAEGVETADQARAVMDLGCDQIQGYFFCKPLPAEEFLRWNAAFRWEQFGLLANPQQLDLPVA